MQTIEKVATFFAVRPSYFFGTAEAVRIEEQLDAMALLVALGRENVRRVTGRTVHLGHAAVIVNVTCVNMRSGYLMFE